MKITLDLTRLVEEGKLTPADAERLKGLAAAETGSLAINILIGFGVVAVAAGAGALVPTPVTALVIGAAIFLIGIGVSRLPSWSILASMCLVIGALMASGGILMIGEGSLASIMLVTVALALASLLARSSLLMAAAVLSLGACFGARAGYWHATYALAIYEPLITVIVFAALALVAYQTSKRLPSDFERIAITAARVSVLMVNFGFWIGSLWGDRLLLARSLMRNDPTLLTGRFQGAAIIPDWAFSIAWAGALIGVGIWGARVNRRWVVNVAAVFGAIHFYTQWFERLGANPLSILIGGLLLLGFALALWRFNQRKA